MTFEVRIWPKTAEAINILPDKSRRIIKDALKGLAEDPFPGQHGDKEKLVLRKGVVIYRIHISRSYRVFYDIRQEEKLILVHDVLTIEQAHKKYEIGRAHV